MWTITTDRGVGVCLGKEEVRKWSPVMRGWGQKLRYTADEVDQDDHLGWRMLGTWMINLSYTTEYAPEAPMDYKLRGGVWSWGDRENGSRGTWMGVKHFDLPVEVTLSPGEVAYYKYAWTKDDKAAFDALNHLVKVLRGEIAPLFAPGWVWEWFGTNAPGLWPPPPMEWGKLERFTNIDTRRLKRWVAVAG